MGGEAREGYSISPLGKMCRKIMIPERAAQTPSGVRATALSYSASERWHAASSAPMK